MATKRCSFCRADLPTSDFSKSQVKKLDGKCNTCVAVAAPRSQKAPQPANRQSAPSVIQCTVCLRRLPVSEFDPAQRARTDRTRCMTCTSNVNPYLRSTFDAASAQQHQQGQQYAQYTYSGAGQAPSYPPAGGSYAPAGSDPYAAHAAAYGGGAPPTSSIPPQYVQPATTVPVSQRPAPTKARPAPPTSPYGPPGTPYTPDTHLPPVAAIRAILHAARGSPPISTAHAVAVEGAPLLYEGASAVQFHQMASYDHRLAADVMAREGLPPAQAAARLNMGSARTPLPPSFHPTRAAACAASGEVQASIAATEAIAASYVPLPREPAAVPPLGGSVLPNPPPSAYTHSMSQVGGSQYAAPASLGHDPTTVPQADLDYAAQSAAAAAGTASGAYASQRSNIAPPHEWGDTTTDIVLPVDTFPSKEACYVRADQVKSSQPWPPTTLPTVGAIMAGLAVSAPDTSGVRDPLAAPHCAQHSGTAEYSAGVSPDQSTNWYYEHYSKVQVHALMLQDTHRTQSYRRAIAAAKERFEGKVVMDIGCGSGVLALFAAQAGAKRVYGIEASGMASAAREVVKANGFEDRVEIIHARVEEVMAASKARHDAKGNEAGGEASSDDWRAGPPVGGVDIIVSEWMGYFLMCEAMLESVLAARDLFLAPHGSMLPSHASLYIAPYHDVVQTDFWTNVYGFDMRAVQESSQQLPHRIWHGRYPVYECVPPSTVNAVISPTPPPHPRAVYPNSRSKKLDTPASASCAADIFFDPPPQMNDISPPNRSSAPLSWNTLTNGGSPLSATSTCMVKMFNLLTATAADVEQFKTSPSTFKVRKNAPLHGFVGWFSVHFDTSEGAASNNTLESVCRDDVVTLDTAPTWCRDRESHWMHALFLTDNQTNVKEGDTVKVEVEVTPNAGEPRYKDVTLHWSVNGGETKKRLWAGR